MSTSSGITDPAGAETPRARPVDRPQAPAGNAKPDVTPPAAKEIEVAVSTSLGEPITSVAREAQVDRVNSIASIEDVAQDIKEAIDTLNDTLSRSPTKAIISRDDQLNRFIVKIADEKSGEVIREIPSEAVLKFARNLQEIKGLLFDKLG